MDEGREDREAMRTVGAGGEGGSGRGGDDGRRLGGGVGVAVSKMGAGFEHD